MNPMEICEDPEPERRARDILTNKDTHQRLLQIVLGKDQPRITITEFCAVVRINTLYLQSYKMKREIY